MGWGDTFLVQEESGSGGEGSSVVEKGNTDLYQEILWGLSPLGDGQSEW